jgi:hypothetical protein
MTTDSRIDHSSTRAYVAACYASIFASTDPAALANRVIGLSELQVTGKQIADAMEERFGARPSERTESLDDIEGPIVANKPYALALYCRKIWGTGQQVQMIGSDVWDIDGYRKATLHDLIVDRKVGPYRDMGRDKTAGILALFEGERP